MANLGLTSHQLIKNVKRKQLGQLLIENGLITSSELDMTLDLQLNHGGRLGDILVEQGLIKYESLLEVLSLQLNVPILDIKNRVIEPEILRLIPEEIARERIIIPFEIEKGKLLLAMAYPDDIGTITDIKAMIKMPIKIGICAPDEIERLINHNYRSGNQIDETLNQVKVPEKQKSKHISQNLTDDTSKQNLDMVIKQAVRDRASDIHIEPAKNELQIRYRIDGILHDVNPLPKAAHLPILSRLKILSDMDIAEQRRPQDGQFTFTADNAQTDIRVATVGTSRGERATLRLLNNSTTFLELEKLGFLPEILDKVKNTLRSTSGMILVGGPTGSGKTTTLYAAINHLCDSKRNIMTIEDPIEYNFSRISQIQVNARAGITFSLGLRSLLRQDPDIILVGEIRDRETAEIAIQAALTGQLVLASIHANDSVSIFFRLIELGIEPYLISSTIIGLIAQRMVRRICSYCSTKTQPSAEEQAAYYDHMKEKINVAYSGKGCALCANTGYHGRTGIFEILSMNEDIRKMLATSSDSIEIREKTLQMGMITMRQDGMIKAKDGVTSIMEVIRNIFTID